MLTLKRFLRYRSHSKHHISHTKVPNFVCTHSTHVYSFNATAPFFIPNMQFIFLNSCYQVDAILFVSCFYLDQQCKKNCPAMDNACLNSHNETRNSKIITALVRNSVVLKVQAQAYQEKSDILNFTP